MRVIEEYYKSDELLHGTYILNITPAEIIKALDDLKLHADDCESEIYDSYILDNGQVQKIKSYLINNLNEDFSKYTYLLSCYDDTQVVNNVTSFEEYIELNEFDRATNHIYKHHKLKIPPSEIFSYIEDIDLQNDDTLEDYEIYELTETQIKRLKPFVENSILNNDLNKYKYYLYHKRVPIALD
ncbi:hypothetical protein [Chryseobacterium hispalense]|uniref:DUF7683 domain-containing protein n=1 Tax=Chryseobacterium hispalense TaxID=1453492 RepID=UPI00391C53E3